MRSEKKNYALVIILVFCASVSALELINANANSNRMEDGAIVSTLSGNVEFLWNDTRIFSDKTIWRRGAGHLQMQGNIKVLRNKQELRCDTGDFRSNGRILHLRGNVFAVDSNHSATMFAGSADYSIDNDSVFLAQNPRIHFWDAASTDTITIFSQTMNYTSRTGIARAEKNVRVVGTDFTAFADRGLYFAETERAMLVGGRPRIEYLNEAVASGDTIHIIFKNNTLTEFYVVGGRPQIDYLDQSKVVGDTIRAMVENNAITEFYVVGGRPQIDYLDQSSVVGDTIRAMVSNNTITEFYVVGSPIGTTREEEAGDSVFMEMTGDTLRFLIGDGQIDQIISERNAQIKRFRQGGEEQADKMWGSRITTTLNCDNHDCGEGNNIMSVVSGDARAIYYDADMRNESAGDTLKLFFDDNGVSRVRILGRVKGRVEN